MESRKFIIRETLLILAGQALCVAAMLGVFYLLNSLDRTVVLGGICGGLLAAANFFFMAVAADSAADKAQAQDVRGGQATVRISFLVRMAVLFAVLFALVKSGLCHPLAAVLPLAFTRPIITLGEFFRKKGDAAI